MYSLFSLPFWRQVLTNLLPPKRFPFDPTAPSIIVPVTLTNHSKVATISMVLDTGASYVVIRPSLAQALNLDLDSTTLDISTASGSASAASTTIPQITVLDCTCLRVPTIITHLPEDTGADGLLGLSFLNGYHLNINFTHHYLTLK